MAKSLVGGSRAYLKGRIGSDVYSLGKDGRGRRQQIVRALPEAVTNPRTSAQMFGRMIMTTLSAAVHDLAPIIDHSFDGIPTGQPSISEFIRLNYALIKADAIAHPSSANSFGLLAYGEKTARYGAYIVSKGKAKLPSGIDSSISDYIKIPLTTETLTVGGFKAAWGLSKDEYITVIMPREVDGTGAWYGFKFLRISFDFTVADTTALTSSVLEAAAKVEGDGIVDFNIDENEVMIYGSSSFKGRIVSRKVGGKYIHSTCQLDVVSGVVLNADTALPTYPTGTEQFLNGGDL